MYDFEQSESGLVGSWQENLLGNAVGGTRKPCMLVVGLWSFDLVCKVHPA
jgi:hypothetical protein